jgi:Arc/MetJ family transcription regulator
MGTDIVLDPTLIAGSMKKAGATTMRETIDIALREYVSMPDYDALLKLRGMGAIDPDYDPKAGDQPAVKVSEATATYRSGKPVRRRPTRR